MNLLQKGRNKLFWVKDFLSGSSVKNNVADIKRILENYNSSESEARRNYLLDQLLRHATKSTSYYKHLENYGSLNDFPVVNKSIIRNDFESFKSTGFSEHNTHKISTSGSTGTPFQIYQDQNKKLRNTADTIYFAAKGNFEIGQQLIFMRIWSERFRKHPLLAKLQNIKMVNVMELSDEYFADLIKGIQKDKSEKGLLGYSSAFTQLCKYLDKIQSPPLNCNVTSIIAIAESLTEYCKQSMEKYFQCSVISRYSNLENGILAQQFPGENSNYHVNWASYVIEILDEERDEPVGNGVLGRIVVTDLFNYAIPMIRYDTGDLGVMNLNDRATPVLSSVQGRKMDMIYDTKGNMINPLVIGQVLYFPNVRQLQLIQTGQKSYMFKLVVDRQFSSGDKLITKYKGYFGEDAQITIEETNDLPILASGKRKLVINNYLPGEQKSVNVPN